MYALSQIAAIEALQNIIDLSNNKIDEVELLKKTPDFCHHDATHKIYLQLESVAADPEINSRFGMIQQHIEQVRHPGKDSLMPKGVERQSEEIDKVTTIQQIPNKKKNKLNNTRSSFNRSQVHSLNNTNTIKNSKISDFSKRKSKKEVSDCVALEIEEEDPEFIKMRKLKDIEIEGDEKQKKIRQDKKKAFEEKKEKFINQLAEKEYTFEFEGDPITSTIGDQKINYHSMKMRLSLLDRKLRSNIKFRESERNQIKVQKKPSLRLEDQSYSMQLTTIPVFQNHNTIDHAALFGLPSEPGKCGLKDFKKHYGGKFTRLDKSHNSISVDTENKDEYQQLFSERRHFKDADRSINQSMVSYRTGIEDRSRRKLALPKIHGKYSTLDRYQQF